MSDNKEGRKRAGPPLPIQQQRKQQPRQKFLGTLIPSDSLPLHVEPQKSILEGKICREPVNVKQLNKIIHSSLLVSTFKDGFANDRWESEKIQLLQYKTKVDKSGWAHITYKQNLGFGRVFPEGGLGAHNLRKPIRHTLFAHYFVDIDIANCQPSILLQLAEANGLPCVTFKYYVNHRDACLALLMKTFNVDKDIAKNLIIRLLYLGGFKDWATENACLQVVAPAKVLQFLEGLKQEMQIISHQIVQMNPIVVERVRKHKPDQSTDHDIVAATVSYVLQEYERRALEAMYTFAVQQGYIRQDVVVLCCDGFMLSKEHLPPDLTPVLTAMMQAIQLHTGLRLTVVQKAMDMGWPENILDTHVKVRIVTDDKDACDVIKKVYSDRIVRTPQGWYVAQTNPTLHWVCGDGYVRNVILHANIVKKIKDNDFLPYGSNNAGCAKIFRAMEDNFDVFPLHPNFIADVNRATKGKVFFQDKYFDLSQQQWVSGSNQLIPLVFIDRPAPNFATITDVEVQAYKEEVLSMFASAEELDMFLQAMSRAIGGFAEDKKWFTMIGPRNSAKSTIQDQTKTAFGMYCTIADPPIAKSFHTGDASAFRWLLTSRQNIARVSFMNEAGGIDGKAAILDGDVIKSTIASGGDGKLARNLYQAESEIFVNTTTFMAFNTLPQCEPKDALLTMVPFTFPFKYVSDLEVGKDISYKAAKPWLRDAIKTNALWRDIFVMLVFQAFKPHPVVASLESQSEIEHLMLDNATEPTQILLLRFKTAPLGWVSSETLEHEFGPARLSKKKLGMFLAARGFLRVPKVQDKIRAWGYQGLELKIDLLTE